MKIIDLLNMISKGEKIPKYIKYYDRLHQKEDTMMCCYNNIIYKLDNNIIDLLDEVEILEEEKKTKPLTKKDIEALGYACGEIQKCFTNGWTKSLGNKPLEEEKKIPEKMDRELNCDDDTVRGLVASVNEIYKEIADKYNEIIDYLKSKGE